MQTYEDFIEFLIHIIKNDNNIDQKLLKHENFSQVYELKKDDDSDCRW